jgi:hypothetical protein
MSEEPGFLFGEDDAAKLVSSLQQCVVLLNETVAYADAHCDPSVVLPYKRRVAAIMFDLGWEILEQGFYKKYPHLRPEDSALRGEKST